MPAPFATLTLTPRRRLKIGLLCFVAAFVLLAASDAFPHAASAFRTTAAVAGVIALGFFVSSALTVLSRTRALLVERYPSQTHRASIFIGVVLAFILGACAIAQSILALVSTNAPLISHHAGSVAKAENPTYFWLSVVFHLVVGMLLIGGSIYGAMFDLKRRR